VVPYCNIKTKKTATKFRRRNEAMMPKDPVMLLSYVNTQLRDFYESLEELCHALDMDRAAVEEKLAAMDYHYDPAKNQFV